MNFCVRIKDIFARFLGRFLLVFKSNNVLTLDTTSSYKNNTDSNFEASCEEEVSKEDDDKIVIGRRSMISKLNSLKQLIKTFEKAFPNEYSDFSLKIDTLIKEHQEILDEYLKSIDMDENIINLTFEIDPDDDGFRLLKVLSLEKDINHFIENTVKYEFILKRVRKLCMKLSALYETSIYHSDKKARVMTQLDNAKECLLDIIVDMKSYHFNSYDKAKRDTLIDLISYADYLIFKCKCRNLIDFSIKELFQELFIVMEFDGLDFEIIIHDLILEELSQISNEVAFLNKKSYQVLFSNSIQRLQNFDYELSYKEALYNKEYWNHLFKLETDLLNAIKLSGNDYRNILFLKKFGVIDDSEIFYSVKSQSYLALADVYNQTQNINLEIVLNILSELDSEITYKDLYFILLLFDVVDVVISHSMASGSFFKNMQNQVSKYSMLYSKGDIEKKKENVLRYLNKDDVEYVKIATVTNDDDLQKFQSALECGNFEFVVSGDAIYLNSFYFNGLDNVKKCLKIRKL